MALLYGLLVGIAMGWILQRVRATSPGLIARNLRLENLTIIKFMALTIAVGSVTAYLASHFLPMHFAIKPTYVLGVLAGGLIFGVGFGLAGYCPGTCVVGAGEGRRDALVTIVGGIVGASVFTLVFPLLEGLLIKPMDLGRLTLPELFHVPALSVAAGLALVIAAGLRLLPTHPEQG